MFPPGFYVCRRHHRLKTHASGWLYAMTPDGVLSVPTPSGVTRTSRPPGCHHPACPHLPTIRRRFDQRRRGGRAPAYLGRPVKAP